MRWTINRIRAMNERHGGHWFEPETLRFFRSRVNDPVYQGPGGVYFVSSEQFVGSSGPPNFIPGANPQPRRYSVRVFDPETGSIDTAGEFQEFASRSGAHAKAERLAKGE